MSGDATAAAAPPRGRPSGLPPGPSASRAVQTLRFVRDPVSFWEDATRRFGQTFTLRLYGPGDVVFISDPPSLKRLFAADRTNTVAPGRNVMLESVLGRRSVLLAKDEEHLRRRKLMLPPFHGERMRAYESVIEEAAERQIEGWPTGRRFPLHPSMQALTLEVILRAVFGMEEAGRRDELSENLVAILAATQSARAVGMAVPRLRKLPPWRTTVARIRRTDELLGAEIASRRADPALDEREDILSMLVSARFEDGTAMDDIDVRDQLMTLLLAGHETTATSLAWAFDQLFHHPEAMERLRDEAEGDGTEWLDAVISESMRIRPVVPFTGRQLREVAELGGYELPDRTVVMASIYLTHMRDDVYPNARAFRPERFLAEAPETFSWVPFGGGTRRCLGASFALMEMRVALRTILRGAVLRAGDPEPERIVRRNVTLAPATGTGAVLERRR